MILKKRVVLAIMLLASVKVFAAASSYKYIDSIETRESGYNAIYLNDFSIPDEGCTLADRAIIRESSAGGRAMLDVALAAMINNKQVVVVVDGCTSILPGTPNTTAPQVIKIEIYRQWRQGG